MSVKYLPNVCCMCFEYLTTILDISNINQISVEYLGNDKFSILGTLGELA